MFHNLIYPSQVYRLPSSRFSSLDNFQSAGIVDGIDAPVRLNHSWLAGVAPDLIRLYLYVSKYRFILLTLSAFSSNATAKIIF